ncbi:MAG: succinylglutamate desuccinylase/aspartoacylase family protein [Rhodospirillales bacterium]|nr:succinylglutamate desuccinylase/aspartoacylase family protein [Rhodospirillales bacterium]
MYDPRSPVIEVMPRDISGLRRGNIGIDYVHRFDSGVPGPVVWVNALTHGNEFCGMTALTWLLAQGAWPVRGTLTLSFANVPAYESFDPAQPLASRFVDRDFNRVWTQDILDNDTASHEARRARELLPLFETADALLDIHSTTFPVRPMWVYKRLDKARQLADAAGAPHTHIVSPGGKHDGGIMVEFGPFGRADHPAAGLVLECGQHFAAAAGQVAIQTLLRFLGYFGVLADDFLAQHMTPTVPETPAVYEISEVRKATTNRARFVRPLIGFEEFAAGELIATDGEVEIRAPYNRCAVIMPKAQLIAGQEIVTLAKRI